MSTSGSAGIAEILARIDAEPIADADALAGMSLAEIEQQLADLGVDVDAQVDALMQIASATIVTPLTELSAAELQQLSVRQVQRTLDNSGVDTRQWLSRAEQLIRRDRDFRAGGSAIASGGSVAAAPRSHAQRPRRRLPGAIAASLALVALGAVTYSLLPDPMLDVAIVASEVASTDLDAVQPSIPAAPEPEPESEPGQSSEVALADTEATGRTAEEPQASRARQTRFGDSAAGRPGTARTTAQGAPRADTPHKVVVGGAKQAGDEALIAPAPARLSGQAREPVKGAQEQGASSVVATRPKSAVAQPPSMALQQADVAVAQVPVTKREPDRADSIAAAGDSGAGSSRHAPALKLRQAAPGVARAPERHHRSRSGRNAFAKSEASTAGAANATAAMATSPVRELRYDASGKVSLRELNLNADDEQTLRRLLDKLEPVAGSVLRVYLRAEQILQASVHAPGGELVEFTRDAEGRLVRDK